MIFCSFSFCNFYAKWLLHVFKVKPDSVQPALIPFLHHECFFCRYNGLWRCSPKFVFFFWGHQSFCACRKMWYFHVPLYSIQKLLTFPTFIVKEFLNRCAFHLHVTTAWHTLKSSYLDQTSTCSLEMMTNLLEILNAMF